MADRYIHEVGTRVRGASGVGPWAGVVLTEVYEWLGMHWYVVGLDSGETRTCAVGPDVVAEVA